MSQSHGHVEALGLGGNDKPRPSTHLKMAGVSGPDVAIDLGAIHDNYGYQQGYHDVHNGGYHDQHNQYDPYYDQSFASPLGGHHPDPSNLQRMSHGTEASSTAHSSSQSPVVAMGVSSQIPSIDARETYDKFAKVEMSDYVNTQSMARNPQAILEDGVKVPMTDSEYQERQAGRSEDRQLDQGIQL
ncbi:hypothetical protein BGZ65_007990 [Modicella reniformis]|uniref:Uncharacterized protein n=1 Tax=Modicella reniformis TaxID=1440133 RepID=A0A9P6M1I8_9FUNG|nr:hypothetical protein BGZ65_007990 [Modicella reniformis]